MFSCKSLRFTWHIMKWRIGIFPRKFLCYERKLFFTELRKRAANFLKSTVKLIDENEEQQKHLPPVSYSCSCVKTTVTCFFTISDWWKLLYKYLIRKSSIIVFTWFFSLIFSGNAAHCTRRFPLCPTILPMRWHVSGTSSSLHRFAHQIFLPFPSSSSPILWLSRVLFRVFPCRSGESGNRKLRWDQTRLTGNPPAPAEAAAPPLAADRSSLASPCSASASRHLSRTPRHDSRHRQASRCVLQTGTPVGRLCSSSESAARSHPEEEQHPFSGDPSCCWK